MTYQFNFRTKMIEGCFNTNVVWNIPDIDKSKILSWEVKAQTLYLTMKDDRIISVMGEIVETDFNMPFSYIEYGENYTKEHTVIQ